MKFAALNATLLAAFAPMAFASEKAPVNTKVEVQEYQYGIRVEEGVLQNINTASDLKKYFKVLEK